MLSLSCLSQLAAVVQPAETPGRQTAVLVVRDQEEVLEYWRELSVSLAEPVVCLAAGNLHCEDWWRPGVL